MSPKTVDAVCSSPKFINSNTDYPKQQITKRRFSDNIAKLKDPEEEPKSIMMFIIWHAKSNVSKKKISGWHRISKNISTDKNDTKQLEKDLVAPKKSESMNIF